MPIYLFSINILFPFFPQNLIVSAETQGGGEKVNELRISNNLKSLDVVSVPLLPSENKIDEYEEDKVSSSNLRMRELGTLRKPVLVSFFFFISRV